jgi:hypothetical protein
MPTKTHKKQTKGPNRSDFIRSLPASMPAAEVVAKGAEAGLTFKAGLVYEVRRADLKRAGKPHGKPGRPRTKQSHPKPGDTHWKGLPLTGKAAHEDRLKEKEREFIGIVLEIGLGRAAGLMHELRNRLVSVF